MWKKKKKKKKKKEKKKKKKKKKKTYEKVKTKKFTELITGRKIDRILNCFNEKLDRIKREVQKRTQYLEKDFFNYIRKIWSYIINS